jgi:hypothetical protein
MKKNTITVLFMLLAAVAVGQKTADLNKSKPDLPGLFLIDLGVNQGIGAPSSFEQGFWGSRTVNIYYHHPIRIAKSKFSFNPGIGLSLERWKFKDGATPIDTVELDSYPNGPESADQIEQYNLLSPTRIYPQLADKSMLVANYVEMPIEFRFDTKPEDLGRSFNFALGGRIGYLYDAFTKVKYNDKGETVKVKYKHNHGLNPLRYGVYTRMGIGNISLFGFLNLSDLFEENKGPMGTTMNSYTVGISVNGF